MSSWPARSTLPPPRRFALPGRQHLNFESPYAPITIPTAARLLGRRRTASNSGTAPHPHQAMNISQGERGGKGDNLRVETKWFLFGPPLPADDRVGRHSPG